MGLTVNRTIYSKIAINENSYSTSELNQIAYAVKEELAISPFLTVSRWVKHRDFPVSCYSTVELDELFNLVLADTNTTVKVNIERI